MLRAYNRTLTPLPADAEGRQIDGRSEGEVDDTYQPVGQAITKGLLRMVGSSPAEDEEPEEAPKATPKKRSKPKPSSTSTTTKKSDDGDEPDSEEN